MISHTGTLVGSTDINLSAQSRTLKAVHRTEGVLVRALPDGTQEWCIARMTGFRSTRSVKNTRHLEIALKFKKKSANWNGENYFSWKLDSGYKLDTGLKLNSAAYQFTENGGGEQWGQRGGEELHHHGDGRDGGHHGADHRH